MYPHKSASTAIFLLFPLAGARPGRSFPPLFPSIPRCGEAGILRVTSWSTRAISRCSASICNFSVRSTNDRDPNYGAIGGSVRREAQKALQSSADPAHDTLNMWGGPSGERTVFLHKSRRNGSGGVDANASNSRRGRQAPDAWTELPHLIEWSVQKLKFVGQPNSAVAGKREPCCGP